MYSIKPNSSFEQTSAELEPSTIEYARSMLKRLKPLYGVNYNLIFIGPVGVGKSTLCNHVYQLLREILTKTFNDEDMKVFYSSNGQQCHNNYRTNEQFKSFISNNPSTFDINSFNDHDCLIDSRYYNALDNQEAYVYDSRYIVDSHNVIIEDMCKNKPSVQRSSSQESLNTFNEYTINAYPEFIQVRGQEALDILKRHLNKEVSTYEFQHFILDCWDDLMTNQPLTNKTNTINVFERCCDDSVICFSNVIYKMDHNRLSKEQLKRLFDDMRDIDYDYHLKNI